MQNLQKEPSERFQMFVSMKLAILLINVSRLFSQENRLVDRVGLFILFNFDFQSIKL